MNIQYKRVYISDNVYISICQLQIDDNIYYGIYIDFQINQIFSDGIFSIEEEKIFADEQALLYAQIASTEGISSEEDFSNSEKDALYRNGLSWITRRFYCNPCREIQQQFLQILREDKIL